MTAPRHMISIRPQVGLPAVTDWRNDAACRDLASACWDPWFPERSGESGDRARRRAAYADARAMCHRCPVKAECLADAIATGERDGMRGGLDPVERKALAAKEPLGGPACMDSPGNWTGLGRHRDAYERPCPACLTFRRDNDRARVARRAAERIEVAS